MNVPEQLLQPRILVIEDERTLLRTIVIALQSQQYRVIEASRGDEGQRLALEEQPDLLILDVRLPDIAGTVVCAELRRRQFAAPILMVTGLQDIEDRVRGLESGADDYLPKPFDLAILMARIRGLLRRHEWLRPPAQPPTQPALQNVVVVGGRTIDFDALELRAVEQSFHLTLMEAKLLRYLIDHEGQTVPRKAVLQDVWGLHEDTDTRAIDNFIVRLRRYLEDDPSRPRHLLTVRGVGYRFVAA